ncbi:caspase family protein [Flammeovirga aprica]|uniref:Caspase family protein n=1 Tax=Flammeovirga aprica JL-4 TaxID=694437 RepID=A0A7X9XBS5_9BACT|nr:caspase family protein [Flammeovirga aprica]NME70904.1 caspase family protein [Flammeovirga aprica JL-4]
MLYRSTYKNQTSQKVLFLLYILFANITISVGQTDRSIVVNPAYEHEFQKGVNSKKYALLVGTDEYDNFTMLNNPIHDVEDIGKVLSEKYGFTINILRNPSSNQLLSTLKEYRKKLKRNDRFLLYIAGHGTYDNIFYKEGFLVMKETKNETEDPNLLTYLPFQHVKNIADNLPSQQVMLMVDVCFGGAFNENIQRNRSASSRNYHWNANVFLQKQLKDKGRFVLSSGRLNTVPDGAFGSHSPFARDLIKALEDNASDSIVTAQKLQLELLTLSSNPILGYFGETNGMSDFVFKARSSSSKVNEKERIDLLVNMYYGNLKELSLEFFKQRFINTVALQKIADEFHDMAKNGNVEASFWVAYMNHRGHGIRLDANEKNRFIQLAYDTFYTEHFENMNDEHILLLTMLQSEGMMKIENHYRLQNQITSSLSEEHPISYYYAGRYCLKQSKLKHAYVNLLKGAKKGNAFCQFELSFLIYREKDKLENLGYTDLNYKDWLLEASRNGLRKATDVMNSQGITE